MLLGWEGSLTYACVVFNRQKYSLNIYRGNYNEKRMNEKKKLRSMMTWIIDEFCNI